MNIVRKILPRKMNNKVLLYSMVIVLISIIGSSLVYRYINDRLIFDSISKVNKQTTDYVKSNIESVVNSVNSYSKLIISNEKVQSVLDEDKDNILERQALLLNLNILMESTPFISEIYLADMEGNLYSAFQDKDEVVNPDYRHSSVVEEAIKGNGSYSFHLNGEDFFSSTSDPAFISFARAIKDLNTQEIIGILVLNIPTSFLVSEQEDGTDNKIRDLFIVADNEVAIHSGILEESPVSYHSVMKKNEGYISDKVYNDGHSFLVSSYWMEDLDWYIVGVISLDQTSDETANFRTATVIIYLVNLIFIFAGVALFSRFFIRPMNKMIKKK